MCIKDWKIVTIRALVSGYPICFESSFFSGRKSMKFSLTFWPNITRRPGRGGCGQPPTASCGPDLFRPLGAGIFAYLHLAKRSMMKIETILRMRWTGSAGRRSACRSSSRPIYGRKPGAGYQIGPEMGDSVTRNERIWCSPDPRGSGGRPGPAGKFNLINICHPSSITSRSKFGMSRADAPGLIRVREFTIEG